MDITQLVVSALLFTLSSTVTPSVQVTTPTESPEPMPVIYGVNPTDTVITPKPQPKPKVVPPQHTQFVGTVPQNQGSCFDYTAKYGAMYGVDVDLLNRIISAESGGNPAAKNPRSTASGCAQFIQSTWAGTRRQMGREWVSPFDAEANVEATAWKIANGGLSAWNASRSKWAN